MIYLAQDYDVSYYSSVTLQKFTQLCYHYGLNKFKIRTISESEKLSVKLQKYHPFHLKTVSNGVDLKKFYMDPKSPYWDEKRSNVVILYFVRDDYRKGKDIAVKALNQLCNIYKNHDWELWTIGEELGLRNTRERNFGYLDLENLKNILSAADIYFLSSRSEGLSTLLLQAIACECAVVGTEAAHIISHEKEGLICKSEDWKSLANNIETLLNNPDQLAAYQRNARLLAEQHSLDKSCHQFERELLNFSKKNVKT